VINTTPEAEYADAHCHLTPPWFKIEDVSRISKECFMKGVKTIVISVVEPKNYSFGLKASRINGIYLTVGLEYSLITESDYEAFENFVLSNRSEIKAIGEIGIDYHWAKDFKTRKKQEKMFRRLIKFAQDNNFNIVVHSRDAEGKAIEIVKELGCTNVLMHCFAGTTNEVNEIIKQDWYISIPTSAVYRKNFRKKISEVPPELMMFETDSPFHSLKYGENNTPCSIPIVVRHAAKQLKMNIEELARITTNNVKKFYGI